MAHFAFVLGVSQQIPIYAISSDGPLQLSLIALAVADDCKNELGKDSLAENHRDLMTAGVKKSCPWMKYDCKLETFAFMTLRDMKVPEVVHTEKYNGYIA
ncbi:unnamed protein product [Strongylus vulgaris]|uniref:Uncharacterized protein n=1 Tax=Strongylus vulgaris TaxID=40348 RepID=A0A3P7JQC3_STRVU|nr:unnamed protein product [Strongylus vulgaris]